MPQAIAIVQYDPVAQFPIVTRFIHDQFAKEYLTQLLSSFGTVDISKKIASEVREVDVWFTPYSSDLDTRELGLLGQLMATPAIFEPFRNPITANDIRTCLLKLFMVQAKWERDEENRKLRQTELPRLWILTPTASMNLLDNARAREAENGAPGIYYLGDLYKSAIIVIHQLPRTPETLWLRLLGRGRVKEQAIQELESLPPTNRWQANVIELVDKVLTILGTRKNKEADGEDEELMVTIDALYQEAIAQLREEVIPQLREEVIAQLREEAIAQLREEARQEGEQRATLRSIANILRVRFGEVDEELAAIVEEIATLPSDEFTPLLLQLSREELLERFRKGAE